VALVCSGLWITGVTGQSESRWDVTDAITREDRRSIVELATHIGIPDPVTIVQTVGGDCPAVVVEAWPAIEGRTVRSAWGGLMRAPGANCDSPADATLPRVGRWHSLLAEAQPLEYWRIRDGDWFVDVDSTADVGYGTAERIVLAVRRGQLVERCASASRPHTAAEITFVTTPGPEHFPEDGTHWVMTRRRSPGSLIDSEAGAYW
jgi:hypothetical protein